jgi:AraC family transcriptional regulator
VVINPPASLLGARNAILWGKARRYHIKDFPGPVSVKAVLRGSAVWETNQAGRTVDAGSYLILNAAEPYTLTIDSRQEVETFCLFFRNGFVEDACRIESCDAISILDEGCSERSPADGVRFFETLQAHDSIVSPILRRIAASVVSRTATGAWLEDQFHNAAGALCKVQAQARKQATRIEAKKASTRDELYRRLLRGKDYLDANFGGAVHLRNVASEACLSPYHFHRLFRQVFRETPNQYLQRKRLRNAQRLLAGGNLSVTQICLEVGFESIPSFSTLFRRNFGCTPREYRARSQKT